VKRHRVNVATAHTRSTTARCPRGSRVAFGGLEVQHYDLGAGDISVIGLKRAAGRRWKVVGHKYQPLAGHLTAIAYCR
jgi:hypothetical protein